MDEPEEELEPRTRAIPWTALALVVALIAAIVFAVLWRGAAETSPEEVQSFLSTESAEVEDVAEQVVGLLINYDAESLEGAAETVRTLATGSFLDEYEALLGQSLGEELEAAGASSEGDIVQGPDVTFASPSEAQALVTTRQTTRSDRNPDGVTFVYVMRVSLVDTSDAGWKADDLEILSRQAAEG